jgi:hypothetical protein
MDRKKTKSVRLKKYEIVYKEYLKNKSKSPEPKKQVREKTEKKVEKKTEKKIKDSGKGRKKLTEYQKFVREESRKDKYKGLKPDERLAKIAKAWKKHNLKTAKQTRNGNTNP